MGPLKYKPGQKVEVAGHYMVLQRSEKFAKLHRTAETISLRGGAVFPPGRPGIAATRYELKAKAKCGACLDTGIAGNPGRWACPNCSEKVQEISS